MESQMPILKIGQYGTHAHMLPSGRWGFVGTIPIELDKVVCDTEQDAIGAFISFFKGLPIPEQREYIGLLRNDVFKLIMEA